MKILGFLLAASAAFAQVPRPEFPQPQFERSEWANLNGKWEFAFDDQNMGMKEHWWDGAQKFGRSIMVPFCFESEKSGIGDTSFHPWVWYRRTLSVPPEWAGKRTLLHFGAVDYRAWVWVNGQLAGTHEGGNVPFFFDITDLLKASGNTVIVRAEDPPTDRYIPRGKQYWKPKSESIFYTRTSGIWQTVWMEPVSEIHIASIRITAGMDGVAHFDATIAPAPGSGEFAPGLALRVGVESGRSRVVRQVPIATSRASVSVPVADAKLWSPENPNLYDVTLELTGKNGVIDKVKSYLGFRTIGIQNGRVSINKQPIYLKTVLDQGYWPDSILTPPSDDAIQYDLRMTKEMGFNGARKHQKLEDPRYLYWADKMGVLVSSEMANAYEFDPDYAERFTREWMEAVERDYNHPSIVIWVPINESWGVPDLQKDPRQAAHLKALYELTKSLDKTRLVIDNEGWEHTDSTDLFAIHDYTKTGDLLAAKYKNVQAGKPGAEIPAGSRTDLVTGYQYNGSPLYLSEFGGIAFIPPGHQVPGKSWGYSGVEKTEKAALARLRGLYEGIAKGPWVGICYTQLTDVEQEINGLMTYDRKPKFPVEQIRAINDLLK